VRKLAVTIQKASQRHHPSFDRAPCQRHLEVEMTSRVAPFAEGDAVAGAVGSAGRSRDQMMDVQLAFRWPQGALVIALEDDPTDLLPSSLFFRRAPGHHLRRRSVRPVPTTLIRNLSRRSCSLWWMPYSEVIRLCSGEAHSTSVAHQTHITGSWAALANKPSVLASATINGTIAELSQNLNGPRASPQSVPQQR
jgi:hypothetical protein